MRFRTLVLLAVCSVCCLANEIGKASDVRFQAAQTITGQKGVYFYAFQKVDWESFAPAWIKNFDENNPSRELAIELHSKMDMFQNTEITYEVEIPADMKEQKYYLLTGSGFKELEIRRLEGVARFSFDPTSKEIIIDSGTHFSISRPNFQGNVIAECKTDAGDDGGGFVVQVGKNTQIVGGDAPVKFHAVLNDDTMTYSYKQRKDSEPLTLSVIKSSSLHPTAILHSYAININGSKYLFVQWAPDNKGDYGYCKKNYSLFQVNKSFKLICSNHYECDI